MLEDGAALADEPSSPAVGAAVADGYPGAAVPDAASGAGRAGRAAAGMGAGPDGGPGSDGGNPGADAGEGGGLRVAADPARRGDAFAWESRHRGFMLFAASYSNDPRSSHDGGVVIACLFFNERS